MSQNGARPDAPRESLPLTVRVLVVLLVLVPLVFHRGTFTVFDQPQRFVLLIGGLTMIAAAMTDGRLLDGVGTRPSPRTWVAATFLVALLLTTLTAGDRWSAWTGLEGRGMGTVTYLVLMGVFVACWHLGGERPGEVVLHTVSAVHLVVVAHALVQFMGWDPMDWDTGLTIGGDVLTTLGNPNFGAAFVGFTLPVLFWQAFRTGSHPLLGVLAVLSTALSAAAVGAMGSTQGLVLVMMATSLLVLESLRYVGRGRWEAMGLGALVAVTLLVLAARPPTLAMVLVGLAIVSVGAVGRHQRIARWEVSGDSDRSAAVRWMTARRRVLGLAAGSVTVVMALVFGERFVGLFSDRFVQRSEFWSVGWEMFQRRPLVGHGLESFAEWFMPLRSPEHASAYETLLTDSVHNVPLGMLAGGGLVLGGAWLAVVVLTVVSIVRALRNAIGWDGRLSTVVLTMLWVGYLAQSVVSVDVPSLALYGWVAAGLLVARGSSGLLDRQARPIRSSRLAGGVLLCGVVVAAVVLSGPLRADLSAHRGQVAFAAADFDTALMEVSRAAELQPDNGYYTETLGRIHLQRGEAELALVAFEHSATVREGNAGIARLVGRVAQQFGYHDMASYWYGDSVADDPHSPTVLAEAARFFAWREEPVAAYQLLGDYHRTESASPEARAFSLEAYLLLGDVPNGRRGE